MDYITTWIWTRIGYGGDDVIEVWIVFLCGAFLGGMSVFLTMKDGKERLKKEVAYYRNGGKVYIFEKEN